MRKAFSPEFLNRVDDMIMFKSLGRPEIHQIIDLELEKLYNLKDWCKNMADLVFYEKKQHD